MSIALIITDRPSDDLAHLLRQFLPDVSVQVWPDITDPDAVTLAEPATPGASLFSGPVGFEKSLPGQ